MQCYRPAGAAHYTATPTADASHAGAARVHSRPPNHGIAMLDLHCHILPGIDDGAVDLEMALQMARIAAADGITTIACTPHIYPGVYDNNATGIRNGRIPTLAASRYLLLEPPHHVAPPRFEDLVFEVMTAGYVPVITHPER